MPGAVLEASTPAAASTSPCRVVTIRVGPRLATVRTASASMAASRSPVTTRPSALLMIFEVTTRMSPSAQAGRRRGDQRGQVRPGGDLGQPGNRQHRELAGHGFSSSARSSAACAICAVAATSVMYSGRARTAMPASSGASTAALSCSSTSHPPISPGP